MCIFFAIADPRRGRMSRWFSGRSHHNLWEIETDEQICYKILRSYEAMWGSWQDQLAPRFSQKVITDFNHKSSSADQSFLWVFLLLTAKNVSISYCGSKNSTKSELTCNLKLILAKFYDGQCWKFLSPGRPRLPVFGLGIYSQRQVALVGDLKIPYLSFYEAYRILYPPNV